jgi:hypothetical protein
MDLFNTPYLFRVPRNGTPRPRPIKFNALILSEPGSIKRVHLTG